MRVKDAGVGGHTPVTAVFSTALRPLSNQDTVGLAATELRSGDETFLPGDWPGFDTSSTIV